jgi:hypothetical protein
VRRFRPRNRPCRLNVFPQDMSKPAPISTVLGDMLGAGADHLTLDLLLERMGERSFGLVLLLLLLLAPVPMSNLPPALAIMLIAFAYLEEDGMLLCGALIIAFVLIAWPYWPHGKL